MNTTRSSQICEPGAVWMRSLSRDVQKILRLSDDAMLTERRRATEQWDLQRRSQYIEALLMRIPPAPFTVLVGPKYLRILDGLERLLALRDFQNDEFRLSGLRFMSDLEGLRWSDVSQNLRRQLHETLCPTRELDSPVGDDAMQQLASYDCPERFSPAMQM